jgi:hypothetical protein
VAESDVELALALGVGRWRAVPFIGVSDRGWSGPECDELGARSVVMDAERELTDPLWV